MTDDMPFFVVPVGKTIARFVWVDIGGAFYCIVSFVDGTSDTLDIKGHSVGENARC